MVLRLDAADVGVLRRIGRDVPYRIGLRAREPGIGREDAEVLRIRDVEALSNVERLLLVENAPRSEDPLRAEAAKLERRAEPGLPLCGKALRQTGRSIEVLAGPTESPLHGDAGADAPGVLGVERRDAVVDGSRDQRRVLGPDRGVEAQDEGRLPGVCVAVVLILGPGHDSVRTQLELPAQHDGGTRVSR